MYSMPFVESLKVEKVEIFFDYFVMTFYFTTQVVILISFKGLSKAE